MQIEVNAPKSRVNNRTVKLVGLPPNLMRKSFTISQSLKQKYQFTQNHDFKINMYLPQNQAVTQYIKSPEDNMNVVKSLISNTNTFTIPHIVPSEFNIISRGKMPSIIFSNGKVTVI